MERPAAHFKGYTVNDAWRVSSTIKIHYYKYNQSPTIFFNAIMGGAVSPPKLIEQDWL